MSDIDEVLTRRRQQCRRRYLLARAAAFEPLVPRDDPPAATVRGPKLHATHIASPVDAESMPATPVQLAALGLDAAWLRDRIAENPRILGLGEVVVRCDGHARVNGHAEFFVRQPSACIEYAAQAMLGELDEVFLVRTLERWDVARSSQPGLQHRALLVAERISSRLSHVLCVLSGAFPLLVLRVSAFLLAERVVLQFYRMVDRDTYYDVLPASARKANSTYPLPGQPKPQQHR